MDGIDPHSPLLQLGALGVFALAVFLLLRDWRKEMSGLVQGFTAQARQFTAELSMVGKYLAALLERERMKGERRAARDVSRSSGVPDHDLDPEETAPLDLPELQPRKPQRAKTDPYMIVRPRNGDG